MNIDEAPYELWPDPDHGPFRITVDVATVGDRREVVGVAITSRHPDAVDENAAGEMWGESRGLPGPAKLTSDILRGPIGAVIKRLRNRTLERDEPVAEDAEPTPLTLGLVAPLADALISEGSAIGDEHDASNGGRSRKRISPQDVARVYTVACRQVEAPTQFVADHFGITHASAAARVKRARKQRLLPPTGQGVAAGAATQDEQD